MPGGKEPDALDLVLAGYGIAPEDIPAMRTAVLDGTASISKEALREAATNAADDQIRTLGGMNEMAKATKNREIDPQWYEQLVASRGRAGIQREAKGISKSAKHAQQFNLNSAANDELLRLASMTDYLDDMRPQGGAITSGFREPGPGMLGLVPMDENMRRTIGANPNAAGHAAVVSLAENTVGQAANTGAGIMLDRAFPVPPSLQHEDSHPYAGRLARARQMREAILGRANAIQAGVQAVGNFANQEQARHGGRLLGNN